MVLKYDNKNRVPTRPKNRLSDLPIRNHAKDSATQQRRDNETPQGHIPVQRLRARLSVEDPESDRWSGANL
jgi:hypothetical protein